MHHANPTATPLSPTPPSPCPNSKPTVALADGKWSVAPDKSKLTPSTPSATISTSPSPTQNIYPKLPPRTTPGAGGTFTYNSGVVEAYRSKDADTYTDAAQNVGSELLNVSALTSAPSIKDNVVSFTADNFTADNITVSKAGDYLFDIPLGKTLNGTSKIGDVRRGQRGQNFLRHHFRRRPRKAGYLRQCPTRLRGSESLLPRHGLIYTVTLPEGVSATHDSGGQELTFDGNKFNLTVDAGIAVKGSENGTYTFTDDTANYTLDGTDTITVGGTNRHAQDGHHRRHNHPRHHRTRHTHGHGLLRHG